MNEFSEPFPKIMGVLNVTPDSFSDGGKYFSKNAAVDRALRMLEEGADIIDVGGESSRPGAEPVSEEEEKKRVLPVLEELFKKAPDALVSIDTVKYSVAKEAVDIGAKIVNDISGLDSDPRLAKLAADKNLELVVMHMLGTPQTMQKNPTYENVTEDVYQELKAKIALARKLGAKKIIADFGVGFGKTVEHNLLLLKNRRKFKDLGVPLLIGLSRKSFMGKILEIDDPLERDVPSALVSAMLLPGGGVDILRVHDVALFVRLKKLYQALASV